jgi:protein TonB
MSTAAALMLSLFAHAVAMSWWLAGTSVPLHVAPASAVRELSIRWQPESPGLPEPRTPEPPPASVPDAAPPAVATKLSPAPPATPGVMEVVEPPLQRAAPARTEASDPARHLEADPARSEPAVPAVKAPAPLDDNRPPHYPAAARRRGQAGLVVILVRVRADGSVESATVAASSGYALLDRAAREAVEDWRFRAAHQAGLSQAGEVEIPIRFRLTAPEDV